MWNNRNYSKPAPKPKEVPLWSPASQSLMKDIEVNWGGFTSGGRKAMSAFEKRWAKRPTEAGIKQGKPPELLTPGLRLGRRWVPGVGGEPTGIHEGIGQDPMTRQVSFAGHVGDRHYDREAGQWKDRRRVTAKTPKWKGKEILQSSARGRWVPAGTDPDKPQSVDRWGRPYGYSALSNIRRISEMRNEEEDLRDFLKSERGVLGKVQTVGTAQTVGRRRATLVGKKAAR